MKTEPLVSVVVPTFNSERFLERCLRSVKAQSYPNIEIIVVDNHSADKTREIAENVGARVIAIRTKRSKARNLGAERSHGEILCFVDADMELDSAVISECVAEVGEGYDGIIIPELSIGKGFWSKCKALEKSCYVGDDVIEAARCFRKNVFDIIGGYDEELEAGEDWDLNQRIIKASFRIGRIESFIKHHEGQLKLRDSMRKKYYYGKTLDRYRTKHPKLAKKQFQLIRSSFSRNCRKLAKDPPHLLGLFLMKFCESLAARIGLMEEYEAPNWKYGENEDYPREFQISHFDREFASYSQYSLENWRVSYVERMLSLLQFSQGDLFLDIGVGGSGYTNIELAKRGIPSLGIDVSRIGMRKAWWFAKKHLGNESRHCSFLIASATALPLRDKLITKVASIAVLEHIEDDNAAVSEISRVAKNKSRLLIQVPNELSLVFPFLRYFYRCHDKKIGHLRHYKAVDLAVRLAKYNFLLSNILYSAHLPRIFSFLLSSVFGENNRFIERLWWLLEGFDHKMSNVPSGLNLFMLFRKG